MSVCLSVCLSLSLSLSPCLVIERQTRLEGCSQKPCMMCQISAAKAATSVSLQKKVNQLPTPKTKQKGKKKSKLRRCPKCLWLIYRGNHHKCSARSRLRNIRQILTENEKEIITHDTMKSKLLGKRSHSMTIRTGGRPAHYTVQKGFVKRRRISLTTVQKVRAETGISGKKTERIVSLFRDDLGNDAVEPYLHNDLIASNHRLDAFFALESVQLEPKKESAALQQKRLIELQNEMAASSSASAAQLPCSPTNAPSPPLTTPPLHHGSD